MPLEQTITIVNNSGKIISTGKQLISIFKEAKASYQDKKAQIKLDRARTISRAQTFDPSRSLYRHDGLEIGDRHSQPHFDRGRPPLTRRPYDEYSEASTHRTSTKKPGRSRSVNGGGSRARSQADSSRGHRRGQFDDDHSHSHVRRSGKHTHGDEKSRVSALTERNLDKLSDASSQAPSRPPNAYKSPYAETIPLDVAMSKMDLTPGQVQEYMQYYPESERRMGMGVQRRRSFDTEYMRQQEQYEYEQYQRQQQHIREQQHLHHISLERRDSGKEIDMNLAYGNVPPDLEDRIDLDPEYQAQMRKDRAQGLVRKLQGLLDEAHCVQHSATSIIAHLQKDPNAAAAVALTLAELSSVVGKMSPAFLGLLKGSSPTIFGLLASPQFLIGTGIAVGVTVVMFGGWKIVKKVTEAAAAREALAYEAPGATMDGSRPAPLRTQSEFSTGIDDALVLDEELSSIETWRRGISPFDMGADEESADYELITPSADKANRAGKTKHSGSHEDSALHSRRSPRTEKESSSNRKTHKSKKDIREREIPERKSSRSKTFGSEAGSSNASTFINANGKRRTKTIEDGSRSRRADEEMESVFRPGKGPRGGNMLKAIFKKDKERSEVLIS